VRASKLLPGPTVLRRYERGRLRGDVLAGVTVAAYLVPQALAYAGLAGVPPVTGLWAALPALVAYALFGRPPPGPRTEGGRLAVRGQMSQRCFCTSGWEVHHRPRPQV
jgi:hypothetical protein